MTRLERMRKGSNQYKTRYRNHGYYYLAGYLTFVIVLGIGCLALKKETIEKAWAEEPIITSHVVHVTPTPTPSIVEPSEKEKIVAYITRLWEKHGTDQVVRAINCFYSESGLRTDAYGVNNNGTNDAGVAQINSIHGLSVEERMDWKTNLDKAYHIYTSWGNSWKAWYGKACN
jgi:hypothetical protein